MKRHKLKYLESLVYEYKKTKREIKLLELDIIDEMDRSANDVEQGSSSVRKITDMTAIKANTLIEDKKLNRMRQVTEAIERVFNGIMEEKQDLIAFYYWEHPNKYTWDGVSIELCMSRSTAIRWRNGFIKELQKELGEY